jgi:energy-coupling factor transporter transmembrane protein EcfT
MCQFKERSSPVHALPAGWKLLLSILLSVTAFGARSFQFVALLFLVNITYYLLARLRWMELWRDIRLFLVQTAIVVILYVFRDGVVNGFWPGVRTGLQIMLFFLPGAVFLRTTKASQIMRSLQRIMPRRIAFFVFTSFRFIPFFAREMREIALAQRLRGAQLEARRLITPRNWPDLFHCLMVPLLVRALKTAKSAALSAEARGFGRLG